MERTVNNLASSKKLFEYFEELQVGNLLRAQAALTEYTKSNLKNEFKKHQEAQLHKSKILLADFVEKNINHFDILQKAGFVADENKFSNVIASLLNPNQNHGLGINPILEVVSNLSTNNYNISPNLLELIEKEKNYISVHRERKEGNTIPDIEIVSSSFIIFLENKIRGGNETYINGKWQTDRQWEALCARRNVLNIPEENIVAILLTPEGKPAKNRKFISMSVYELINSISEAVERSQSKSLKNSVATFFEFYSWK